MAGQDYKKIGQEIVDKIGRDNIQSITHCATRLRVEVYDRQRIDDDEIEKIDEVKGVFFNAGQYQVILGTGIVDKVYKAIVEEDNTMEEKETDVDKVKEEHNTIKKGVRTLADVFVTIIP
ncbi:MAG: PTS transporter subunit EIIB, partial [Staphylococcus equorum]|nr:PTS transporter subunit EIIB [Staphylococcus equorum]